jgi:hypothetical protein
VVANRWIRLWLACCNWIVVALIVALALLRSMRGPLITGAAAIVVAAIATGIAAWYARPSAYDAAQRLDHESRLGDRVSTAVYFWTANDPSELMMRQRTDALEHLATIRPRELFPLQAPPKMWRAGALIAGLCAICVFHSVYGPPITRLKEKAAQSRTLVTLLSPMTRAIEFARGEKLGELAASNDKDRQASETQKPLELPPMGETTAAAQATAANLNMNMLQGQMPANGNGAAQGQLAKNAQASQQAGTPANAQSASTSDQQASQPSGQGQQSLGQKALQALENLMSSALSSQQNSSQSASNAAQTPNARATSMQSMAGSAQMASSPNQAAQGQTSNSQGAQTQTTPTPGKHTGAGNGTSPWRPGDEKDTQLAGNVAKEHVELQTTGYRGPPGKERADVAPGTAQIPLQDVSPQTVTTVNGAGQDSVPPRYRQYVQDYFQRSGK